MRHKGQYSCREYNYNTYRAITGDFSCTKYSYNPSTKSKTQKIPLPYQGCGIFVST